MSLQIIYGRAGSGKTKACLDTACKLIEKGSKNILFIVPEQYSLQTERRILESFPAASGFVDVLSFERLAERTFSQVGPVFARYLDDCAKQMLMQKTLLSLKNKLTALSFATQTEGFAKIILDTISEFKRYNVTPQALFEAADRAEGFLKLKLADVAMIYEKYLKLFAYPDADEEDNLSVLLEKIKRHDLFRGCNIIIDSFSSFSAKQMAIIEEFMIRCPSVTVSLTTDSLQPTDNIADIFYAAKKTANRLILAAHNLDVSILPNVYTGCCMKFEDNKELLHLESNFFKYPAEAFDDATENISIFRANNYYGEVESAAAKILRLCRKEGYRFRDIAVITKELSTYAPLIRSIFSEYGIAFYLDQKYTALDHPLTHSIMSLFRIIIHNFQYEAIFTWLKSDYCPADKEDVFLLENYVLACGNTKKMWTSDREWTYLPKGFTQAHLEKINAIRPQVAAPIKSFTEKFSGRKTVREISQAFVDFLYESGANLVVEENIIKYRKLGLEDKSDQEAAVWNAIIKTMDNMVSFLGDEYISFEKYYSIFTSGLAGMEIGQIPPTVDQVQISTVDRFKSQDVKCVFILGVTNGVFPASYTNEGLLSDKDRAALSKEGISLAEDTATKQAGENQIIYSAITSATDKLFFFYPIADSDGGSLYPSTIIERLLGIFPNIKTEDNIFQKENPMDYVEGITPTFNKMLLDRKTYAQVEAWFAKNNPERLNQAKKALKYTNMPQKLSKDAVRLLYTDAPKGSISRAEQYSRCQYAYFLNYGLKVKERQKHNIEAVDEGTFMHEIIENYTKIAKEADWQNVTEEFCKEKIKEITHDVLSKYLSETHTEAPGFPFLLKKVEKIMSTTAWHITRFYQKSSFVPLGYEISFEEGGDFPPIELEIGGTKVVLRGKVDRADIWRTDQGNFVSIVDYKSGNKNIDFSEILCGVQIQLPVYIKAVCEALSKKEGVRAIPAAMLYYKLDSPIILADQNMSDEKIMEELQKKLKMQGITVEHEAINKSINTVFAVKSLASVKEIDRICEHAFSQLKKAFTGVLSGSININPVRVSGKTACDFCPYGSVCQFDPAFEGNKYRNIKKINREEFLGYGSSMD
ncbi:MAG: exodeoxyribonuclease V subunit gamma [Eubacteriales bacterium]|jgi:ATP-dependent helicase/nuclease subunit B|nr:exodeoxyribonuclease V subunit gamma [Eubacteriales bacterium]